MKKLVLVAMGIIMVITALAPLISNAQPAVDSLRVNGLYRVKDFREITPIAAIVDGKTKFLKSDEESYVLLQDEPIRVDFLANGTLRVTRGSTPAEEKINPTELIVHENDLALVDLEAIPNTLGLDLTTLYVAFIAKESANARAGSAAFAGRCTISNWGNGGCVRYIKGTEGISGTLGNGGAVAGNLHRFHGYRIVDKGTCRTNPPAGTIASWAGHVGKWDGSCWRTNVPAACNCNHGDPGRGAPILCVIR